MKTEQRFMTTQFESSEEGVLTGYAALYNSLSQPLGATGFREKIAPGAFTRALNEKQEVVALFNHDENQILGRTSSGTLMLSEDSKGLRFSVKLPDTSLGRDIRELVKRGDISGASFGFNATKDSVQRGNPIVRTLEDLNLFDVSVVVHPAYLATSVEARSTDPESVTAAATSELELAKAKAKLHLHLSQQ